MKKGMISSTSICILMCSLSGVHAMVWYVHPDSAMNCIQDCLDSCSAADTVVVGPGIYFENIVWPNTQSIDLISEFGPDTTIIDGGNSARVIDIANVVDSTTTVMGFTIRKGFHSYSGGGIFIGSGSSPTITGNIITENTTGNRGGGIRCENNSPIIIGNTITNNTAYRGGGISCYQSSALIDSNIVRWNTATGHAGGGIRCQTASIIISNNVITDNWAIGAGGGMSIVYGSSALITGNYVNSNTSSTSSGGGINIAHNCSVTVTDNTVTNNSAPYGGIAFNDASIGTVRRNIITGNICTNAFPSLAGAGFDIYANCSPTIDSNTIANNIGIGIFSGDNSTPLIQFNNIYGHTLCGVSNEDTTITVSAENNWWGHASGPFHPTANPNGQGDSVSDYVDFTPWLADSVEWVGIKEDEEFTIHDARYKLMVYPNPFRDKTDIRFQLLARPASQGEAGDPGYTMEEITLKIYDATGRLVKSFSLSTDYCLLSTAVSWDGTDSSNRKLGSGVYFLKLAADGHRETKKIVLVK